MEIESIKNIWQAYEGKADNTILLNEQSLQHMLTKRSHSSLEHMKSTEYLVGSLTLLFLALFLLMGSKVGSSREMIISHSVTIAAFLFEFCISVYKLVFLSRMDLSAAVTDTMKKVQWFQLFIIRERIISLAAVFILAPAVYACVYQWTMHKSALSHLPFTMAEIAITLVLCIIFSLIMYRKAYLNHIHAILANLEEIDNFKKEN